MTELSEQSLTTTEATDLLEYAESCLEAAVLGTTTAPAPDVGILTQRLGAFATLRREGTLRGCIGTFAGSRSLGEVLPQVVRDAALADYRFEPVTGKEFESITIELSILGQARSVSGTEEINLGRDGIILQVDGRQSVFLPEVPTDQGWDMETTLSQLSRKSGLSSHAWQSPRARFMTFQSLKIKRDVNQGGTIAVRLL